MVQNEELHPFIEFQLNRPASEEGTMSRLIRKRFPAPWLPKACMEGHRTSMYPSQDLRGWVAAMAPCFVRGLINPCLLGLVFEVAHLAGYLPPQNR